MIGLAPEADRIRPFLYDGEEIIGVEDSEIVKYDVSRGRVEALGSLPLFNRAGLQSRFPFKRLARWHWRDICAMPNGSYVGVFGDYLCILEPSDPYIEITYKHRKRCGPLNLCVTPQGKVICGEYGNNATREEVYLYGSDDGRNWFPIHRFPEGEIRHIHNVVYDTYRDGIWILTGDVGEEVGLWFTDDMAKTLRRVRGGEQCFRAVDLFVTEEGLIIPSDSPLEKNGVGVLNCREGTWSQLTSLPNSCFDVAKVNGVLYLSTVPEPSPVNDTEFCYIFESEDGVSWRLAHKVSPSRAYRMARTLGLSMVMPYPRIIFPRHIGDCQKLLYYSECTSVSNGKMRFLSND